VLYVKTKRKDLHTAVKALKRLVSKRLKMKRHSDPQFEETFVRRQCMGRFTFKGDAQCIQKLLEEKGFVAAVGMAADQKRIRLTKMFTYRGLVYTARVTIYPDMKRLAIIAMAEPEPALF
jgi:hypothetical protein